MWTCLASWWTRPVLKIYLNACDGLSEGSMIKKYLPDIKSNELISGQLNLI